MHPGSAMVSVVRSPGVDVWERWRGAARSRVDVCHTGIGIWVYVRSYRMDGYERERAVSLSMHIVQDGVLTPNHCLSIIIVDLVA